MSMLIGCRSSGTRRYEDIATKANPAISALVAPLAQMLAADATDVTIVDVCRGQNDALSNLRNVPDDDHFDHLGRTTHVGQYASHVMDLSPPCREAIPRNPDVCARLCLELWIALAHETLRLSRNAKHYGVDIVALRVTP